MSVNMAERERIFLKFLIHAQLFQVKFLLSKATPLQLKALAEVCFNLRFGELDPHLVKSLRPYTSLIRQLSQKSLSLEYRKKLASKSEIHAKILRLSENLLP